MCPRGLISRVRLGHPKPHQSVQAVASHATLAPLGLMIRLGQMRILRRTGPSGLNGGDRNVSLSWCPSCLSDLGKLGWEGTRPGDTRCLPSGPPGGGQTRQKEGQPVWPHWRMRAWWQSGPQGVITGFHLGSFSAPSV